MAQQANVSRRPTQLLHMSNLLEFWTKQWGEEEMRNGVWVEELVN